MSFNRLDYDDCAYSKTLRESTNPLYYSLYIGQFEHISKCPLGEGTSNLPHVEKTENESELWNITRRASKCPERKYNMGSGRQPQVQWLQPRLCESVYKLTPSGLKKPVSNGLKPIPHKLTIL